MQWDVAAEFASLEGVRRSYYQDPWPDIVSRLTRLGQAVPPDVELGYHLCYGDLGHRHFAEPTDTGKLVLMMNLLSAEIRRPIAWFHIPVPRNRTDDDYFAPLALMHLQPSTKVYLGLIHMTDGVAGARQRMEKARRFLPQFGIATECGFGRRPSDAVPGLLHLHRTLVDAEHELVGAAIK